MIVGQSPDRDISVQQHTTQVMLSDEEFKEEAAYFPPSYFIKYFFSGEWSVRLYGSWISEHTGQKVVHVLFSVTKTKCIGNWKRMPIFPHKLSLLHNPSQR